MCKPYNNIYKTNKSKNFYNDGIVSYKNKINDNIEKRIDDRISKLKKLGYEYGFNKNNIKISEKCLRKFIGIVNFYKYPTGIGLDENGYFSLDLKNNNYFMSFSFQIKLHLCIYNFQKDFTTKIINPENFFKHVNSYIYSDFFNKKIDDNFMVLSINPALKNKSISSYNQISIFNFKETVKEVKSEDSLENIYIDLHSNFLRKKTSLLMKIDDNFIRNHSEKILQKNYKGTFFKYYAYGFMHWQR